MQLSEYRVLVGDSAEHERDNAHARQGSHSA